MNNCVRIFDEIYKIQIFLLKCIATNILDEVFIVTPGTVAYFVIFNTCPFSVAYTISARDATKGLISIISIGIYCQVGLLIINNTFGWQYIIFNHFNC